MGVLMGLKINYKDFLENSKLVNLLKGRERKVAEISQDNSNS